MLIFFHFKSIHRTNLYIKSISVFFFSFIEMKISSVVNAELIIIMLYTGLPIPSEMDISVQLKMIGDFFVKTGESFFNSHKISCTTGEKQFYVHMYINLKK